MMDLGKISLDSTLICAGTRAMRQLLPPVHLLPEGQDAHRLGDRRAGGEREGRRQQQQRQQVDSRQHQPHRRGQHSGHGE